jgi:hypothetical protein
MAVNQEIRNKLPPDAVVFDNHSYDNSIIGTTFDGRAIYEFNKMVKELMVDEGWTEEEAIEWIEFNTIRALPYGGEKTPMIVYTEEE